MLPKAALPFWAITRSVQLSDLGGEVGGKQIPPLITTDLATTCELSVHTTSLQRLNPTRARCNILQFGSETGELRCHTAQRLKASVVAALMPMRSVESVEEEPGTVNIREAFASDWYRSHVPRD